MGVRDWGWGLGPKRRGGPRQGQAGLAGVPEALAGQGAAQGQETAVARGLLCCWDLALKSAEHQGWGLRVPMELAGRSEVEDH